MQGRLYPSPLVLQRLHPLISPSSHPAFFPLCWFTPVPLVPLAGLVPSGPPPPLRFVSREMSNTPPPFVDPCLNPTIANRRLFLFRGPPLQLIFRPPQSKGNAPLFLLTKLVFRHQHPRPLSSFFTPVGLLIVFFFLTLVLRCV